MHQQLLLNDFFSQTLSGLFRSIQNIFDQHTDQPEYCRMCKRCIVFLSAAPLFLAQKDIAWR